MQNEQNPNSRIRELRCRGRGRRAGGEGKGLTVALLCGKGEPTKGGVEVWDSGCVVYDCGTGFYGWGWDPVTKAEELGALLELCSCASEV